MSLDDVEKRERILACVNNGAMAPGFFKCKTCPATDKCKIFNSTDFYDQQEIYYQNLRSESLENRATYFKTSYGMWQSSEASNDWKSCKKNEYASDLVIYQACAAGDATHPKFWKCDKCNAKNTCSICKFRKQREAEKKALKDQQAREMAAKINNFFAKPFEAVADIFDKIFRR